MASIVGLLRRPVRVALCACIAGAAGSTAAYTETEPNDTLATAQIVGNPVGGFLIDGGRSFANPSDDFFSFWVSGPGLLRIESNSADGSADSIMGLFDGAGNLLASNDDGPGAGTMSVIEYLVGDGQAGTFSVGFSGYNPGLLACTGTVTQCYDTDGDFVFDTFVAGGGAGGSTGWDYSLSFSGVALVPEPPAVALLGAGLALGWLNRRRVDRGRAPAG